MRLPQPEASYSSGLMSNFELALGPWFVLVGGVLSVSLFFSLAANARADQSPVTLEFVPVGFFLVGVVFCYLTYFRRPYRLEMNSETLYWFLPFHRLRGRAVVADIASIRTEQSFQWGRTRTVIVLRDGRTVSVIDGRGIGAFVDALVARSPDINRTGWKAQRRFYSDETIGSFYVKDDD